MIVWCGERTEHPEHHIQPAGSRVCKGMPAHGVRMSEEQLLGYLRGADDARALRTVGILADGNARALACFNQCHEDRIERLEAALRQARGRIERLRSEFATAANSP